MIVLVGIIGVTIVVMIAFEVFFFKSARKMYEEIHQLELQYRSP